MPDCDYCEQSFADEGSLLEHMSEAHEAELGRIDQRRVEEHYGGSGAGLSTTVTYAVVGIVIVAVIGGALYAAVGAFGGGPPQRVHEHGTINMTIDGERMDFSASQYTSPTDFHFHGSGPVWHMHPSEPGRLTLSEAMADIGIDLSADAVTVNGATYRESDPGTNITIRVEGEPVNPTTYELHGTSVSGARQGEGDDVVIRVETDG